MIQVYVVYRRHTLVSKIWNAWKEKNKSTSYKQQLWRVRVAVLIADEIDSKTKAVTRNKEEYFIMISQLVKKMKQL